MKNMTKKQRKTFIRVIIVLIIFAVLMILDKTGALDGIPLIVKFFLFFIPYLIIGYDVLLASFKNIAHGQVFDEHFLMMIATLGAFGLSLLDDEAYAEALAVMLFYQVGELFQSIAVGRSRQSITEMMSIAPEFANLEKDGKVEEVDPEDVHIGDIFVVKPGEKVPLDGIVIEGESFLNTAALTGESVPRKASKDDEVISGCVNGEGTLRIRAIKEYEDSTVAKILDLVENASSRKARLEQFITRFARVYTPIVTIGAVALAILPPIFGIGGLTWADSIRRACNFLIVSCPCALVISVPLGFFGGIGASSKFGVLVKGSNYLEAVAGLSTMVFDKTGTLTKGEFKVQKVLPEKDFSEQQVLELATLGEGYSNHPIAKSIREAYGDTAGLDFGRLSDSKEEAGHGINVLLDGKELLVGNIKLLNAHDINAKESTENGTIVYVAFDKKFAGCIVINDTVKDGVIEAITGLKAAGVKKNVMLTGDRKSAAEAVAAEIGIDEVHSDLLPQDKVSVVESLLSETEKTGKKLGFVGDGINDAPVLMRADIGFAMGAIGSDAAIEAADIVLMDDDIRKIPKVIRIAKHTMNIVRANVTFALTVKLLIIVLSIFGLASMWAAVFGDVGVTVICIIASMTILGKKY